MNSGEFQAAQPHEFKKRVVHTPIEPFGHERADAMSGWLIKFVIVFAPWAFGTVQLWSTWVVNVTCYLLGLLLVVKYVSRERNFYKPEAWVSRRGFTRIATVVCAITMWTMVALVLISAINYAAIFETDEIYTLRDHLKWLPTSYDAPRTWHWFWIYLGMACFFWAVQDWLSLRSEEDVIDEEYPRFPKIGKRLRQILWTLGISSALLGLQAIAQRVTGSSDLLWIVDSGNVATHIFGVYVYRSHAAQYLNLIWPAIFGFWIALDKAEDSQASRSSLFLLTIIFVISGSAFASFSRAGAAVTIGCMGLCFLSFWKNSARSLQMKVVISAVVLSGIVFGFFISGKTLMARMDRFEQNWNLRNSITYRANTIAQDFAVWGAGAGVSDRVYFLYTATPTEAVAVQMHNDWVETRIAFGGVGTALIAIGIIMAGFMWVKGRKLPAPAEVPIGIWIGLIGLILHSRFDYPLQVHSILLIFTLMLAILFSISRRAARIR